MTVERVSDPDAELLARAKARLLIRVMLATRWLTFGPAGDLIPRRLWRRLLRVHESVSNASERASRAVTIPWTERRR